MRKIELLLGPLTDAAHEVFSEEFLTNLHEYQHERNELINEWRKAGKLANSRKLPEVLEHALLVRHGLYHSLESEDQETEPGEQTLDDPG